MVDVLVYTLTWAGIGLGVRFYQLGIMKRPLSQNLWGHGISTLLFGSLGYYFYNLKIHQRELLKVKRQELQKIQESQSIRSLIRQQQNESSPDLI
ncbi:hypothetical protein BY996DRAFT_4590707 [Phakopsora pachyrhizi]|nr:hypothetical protein BY996DRAFT_4590707 [Phakopsora pachyrhizi]